MASSSRPDEILAPGASLVPEGQNAIPIVQASRTPGIPASSSPSSAPTTTFSGTSASTFATSATSSQSTSIPSPTPTSSPGLSSGLKAVAIAVPIAIIVLLIPLIYLLIRSHQIRKAAEQRGSQPSQQAMIQHYQAGSPDGNPPDVAPKAFEGVNSRPRSQQLRKPVNSLGLFNFEFSPTHTPSGSRPATERFSRAFSLMNLKSKKSNEQYHDQMPVGNRDSKASTLVDPAATKDGPASPLNPHFAPLNQIGVAQTRDGRSRPNRSPPRDHASQLDGGSPIRQPEAHRQSRSHKSQIYEHSSHSSDTRDKRPDHSNNTRTLNRQPSAISHVGDASHNTNSRYSDVSALTDEGDNRRSSNPLPGPDYGGGAQPYRVL